MMEETVESLRQVAPHWSLAGDHKLLDILQTTHQRIISKCKEVTDQLDVMVTSLDDASISLQNVNNRFMALSNSQFIESRVYDDDVDVAAEKSPDKEPPKPISLESDLQCLKRGLQVLEAAHESLTILRDSDTDTDSDDDAAARTVLRPRDMYSERPLPYVIGTAPWRSKWHAGLVYSDSESEGASVRARSRSEYSDSEPEPPPCQPADVTMSDASSERGESPPPPAQRRPAGGAAELPQMVEREVEYEPPPTTNKVYRPQQPTTGTVFPDEPPPLDYSSDSQDDDIFAGLHKSQPYSTSQGAADLFRFPQQQGGRESSTYEEVDIFSDFAKPVTNPSAKPRPPLLPEQGNMFPDQGNMFPDQGNMFPNKSQPVPTTQDTVDDRKSVKKPIGAISVFGSNKGTDTIGAAILKRNRKPSTSGDDSGSDAPETPQTKTKDIFDDLFAKSQKMNKDNVVKDVKVVVEKPDVAKTKVDLFSDDIFDDIDDIFTTNAVRKPENNQKSLFDDDLFSEIAAPKTVKSNEKSSDNKKSLFDSDDDELFGDKNKILKDTASASGSTKISKREEITKINEIIKDDLSKESINNSTKICKRNEEVTTKVEITIDSNKISNVFDNNDGDDIFSNVKTDNKMVQNKLSPGVDNISKPDKSVKSPSLFDDDDEDLFTKPIQSNKPIRKDTAINNQGKTDDIFGNTEDHLFVGASKTSNLTQNDTAGDETDRVIKSSDTFTNEGVKSNNVLSTSNITVKNTVAKSERIPDRDVNIGYTINSDVIKSRDSDDDDFEQDFDDLPASEHKNIIIETKPSDIFGNTDDLFAKPAEKHKDNNESSSIDKLEFNDNTQTTNKIIDNTQIGETITEHVDAATDSTHIESFRKEESFQTPKTIPKSDNADTVNVTTSKSNINIDKRPETPENLSSQTKNDNNKPIITGIDAHTSVFDDIFTEPPVFEKPKEPKRSKNVNALFDDDSDDEALFFKKNDVITDEKPDDYKLSQDRFDIFIDEPPEVDVDAKIYSDDEQFSSLPVVPTGDEIVDKNVPKDSIIEHEIRETGTSLFKHELDRGNVSDDDIFSTLPKPALPRPGHEHLDKNTGVGTENFDINTRKGTENNNTDKAKDIYGIESSTNVVNKANKASKSESDDDLFKTQPKTAIKPISTDIGSDDDLFRLPKVEKPKTTLLKSEKSPELPTKITTVFSKTSDIDDEELFKSLPGSEKDITSLPKTAINKSVESTNQSDDLFKLPPKDKPVTRLPKNETKADSDEDLFKTLPKNIALPQNEPQKNLESNTEESPKKVGKLKSMNFNINVNALLPGASPKKQKTELSPTEPEEPESKMQTKYDSKTKPEPKDIDKPDPVMVKSVSFEDEPESGILDNKLSKERAKIQVKRRPSTRRARREAVRKSAIDIGDDSTDNSSSIDDPPKTHRQTHKHEPEIDKNIDKNKDLDGTVINAEKSSQISENTSPKVSTDEKKAPEKIETVDTTENQPVITARSSSRDVNTKIVYILNDEDIFNTPAVPNPSLNTLGNIYTGENVDKDADTPNLKSSDTKSGAANTFKSDSLKHSKDNSYKVSTSSNLKSSDTKSTKTEVGGVKKSIFDSDSDGELFTVKREVKKVVKGPLFSDDDDDDLFGVKKKNEPKPQASRSAAVKEPQKLTEPVFDDPLSMLGDDD